jgi:hypothetical protein
MGWAQIALGAIPALAVLFGIVFGFGKWTSELKENTKATQNLQKSNDRLAEAMDKMDDKITTSMHSVDLRLENHETRLIVAEKEITDLKYHK